MNLNETYWDDRYVNNDIGWDLGSISMPLKMYFDQLENKNLKILIPGGGNSYEAEYLHKLGFGNVYVVDVSKTALHNLKRRIPSFPSSHLIHNDFFELKMVFDLIIEQTFFCAIDPTLRKRYVEHTNRLLKIGGKIVGLLFNDPLYEDHPPFGGNKEHYLECFSQQYNIDIMQECYNSMDCRTGKELFIKLLKK